MDLIGKDAIVVRDSKQVTEFQPGILTWALQRPWRSSSTSTTPAAPM